MDSNDWIFDYILHFFKSAEWDAAVMGFIDNNCAIFVNDEENKFEYSEIHQAFVNKIEALINSQLAKVGVSNELFVAACLHARHNREINREVYEQMVAMDDFLTFKKLMIKRNVELGYEALQALQKEKVPIIAPETEEEAEAQFQRAVKESEDDSTAETVLILQERTTPKPHSEIKESSLEDCTETFNKVKVFDRELCAAMDQNLMEMEVLHKREEIEQLELEQAIAESLAIEKERMKLLTTENEISLDEAPANKVNNAMKLEDARTMCIENNAPLELESENTLCVGPSIVADSKSDSEQSNLPPKHHVSKQDKHTSRPLSTEEQSSNKILARLQAEMCEKRRLAREAFCRNQDILRQHREQERAVQDQAGVTPENIRRRERQLKEQRDRILAKKNAERKERLAKKLEDDIGPVLEQQGELRKWGQSNHSRSITDDHAKPLEALKPAPDENTGPISNERRSMMRVALARRMKQELLETEEERLRKMQSEQFTELDRKLRLVERLRDENRIKEIQLADAIAAQQTQRFRNIQLSAAQITDHH